MLIHIGPRFSLGYPTDVISLVKEMHWHYPATVPPLRRHILHLMAGPISGYMPLTCVVINHLLEFGALLAFYPITYMGVGLPGSLVTVLWAIVTRKFTASGPVFSRSLSL